jgi:hypothetical protein
MDDEVLAGAPPLVGVMDAGVDERFLDTVTVDRDRRLVRVFLDDRKQVAEQAPFGGGELGPVDLAVAPGSRDLIDRTAGTNERRSAALRPQPLLRWSFPSLRNRRPSSYRRPYAL